MIWLFAIPFVTFCLLVAGEATQTRGRNSRMPQHKRWDWVLNLSGFVFQGALTPWIGYLLASQVLPSAIPSYSGVLKIGWWGSFVLNFVVVDFLFYWQHRWFHQFRPLWNLHQCHHAAERVDVWITSRNTLLIHFIFVYLLLNPLLGYLVEHPEAFFIGAILTACLDLLRHANIDYSRMPGARTLSSLLGKVFVLPSAHHQHHASKEVHGNYGANLILWDRFFGTLLPRSGYPDSYGVKNAPEPAIQLLYPFKRPSVDRRHAPES